MTNSVMLYLSGLLTLIPMIGLIGNLIFNGKRLKINAKLSASDTQLSQQKGAQFATGAVGLGLVLSFILLIGSDVKHHAAYVLGLKLDSLAFLMTTLIFFVSMVVHQFSVRYMAGDRQYNSYFYKLSLITSGAAIMALADNVVLFLLAWCVNNCLLISLMIHKQQWDAAASSGKLAFKTLFIGAVLFLTAILLMYFESGTLSISGITQQTSYSHVMLIALLLLVVTAMTQSALWPFHRWLTSSLNSPTPVSAIMHAGLVNGGGFLLVRFAPMFSDYSILLDLIFVVGAISAAFGTLWKLVQSNVKRMLACSTMGQMGFMMIQCGLGLFPAAIAHLIWHGLFKAYLFLSAGSVVTTKKVDRYSRTSTLIIFIISCVYGLLGAYGFAYFSEKPFYSMNTTTFLVGFAFIASTQLAHAILQNHITFFKHVLALVAALVSGAIYGCSIHLIEALIPSTLMLEHAISALHIITFMGFMIVWLVLNLDGLRFIQKTDVWKRSYLALLNGSQPHPSTVTSVRQSYQY
jgi:NAD(P)H-quinone oxidoreductase subunit 5